MKKLIRTVSKQKLNPKQLHKIKGGDSRTNGEEIEMVVERIEKG